MPTSRAALWTAIALAALTACSGHTGRVAARRIDRGTTTSSEDPTTTTARATTTTARKDPPRPLPGLGIGSSGPQVLALQQRLAALHYDIGTPDGHFGQSTYFAVVAFQKVSGMSRTGRATDDVIARVATATDPKVIADATKLQTLIHERLKHR